MVSDSMARRPNLDDTQQMRHQAKDLLERLLADRDRAEQRLAETGKRDPIRTVTGRTALENAIVSARSMVDHLDDLLAQQGHRQPAEATVVQFPSRRVLKPQSRLAGKFSIKGPILPLPATAAAS